MDGILFLYINWILWIMVSFLMPKSREWVWTSRYLLLLILTSSFVYKYSAITINMANLLIMVGSLIIIAMHTTQIRSICFALTVCIGYVGALMWEMVSPVWIFASRPLLYSILAFLLMIVISHSVWLRIAIWGLGSSVGEIVYSYLLLDFGFKDPAGDYAYLDVFSLVVMLIVMTAIGGKCLNWLENTITQLVKRKAGIKT